MQTRMDKRDGRRWYRCTLASGDPPVRIKTWSADEAARIVSRVFGEPVVVVEEAGRYDLAVMRRRAAVRRVEGSRHAAA